MLLQREAERQHYLGCTGNKQSYQTQMLEKQSEELCNLRDKIREYDRREQICDRKWHDLIKENELSMQEIAAYKEQLVK